MSDRSGSDAASPTEFARAVLKNAVALKAGETITVEAWTHTLPWAVALAREARRMKATPLILYNDEEAFWDSVEAKEDGILGASPAHEWAALGRTDVYLHMWGPADRGRLANLPEKRQEKLVAWNPKWYTAALKNKVRGARLEVGRPHASLAKMYGVDEGEWRDQVVRASMVAPSALRR